VEKLPELVEYCLGHKVRGLRRQKWKNNDKQSQEESFDDEIETGLTLVGELWLDP